MSLVELDIKVAGELNLKINEAIKSIGFPLAAVPMDDEIRARWDAVVMGLIMAKNSIESMMEMWEAE